MQDNYQFRSNEEATSALRDLGYQISGGVVVLPVEIPEDYPRGIMFENRPLSLAHFNPSTHTVHISSPYKHLAKFQDKIRQDLDSLHLPENSSPL